MKDFGIEKETLSSLAVKTIIDLIEKDVFKIGEKLDAEQKLADKLNISRPVLREALQKLEHEGYIVRKHGIGTFVISKTPILTTGIEKLDSMTELVKAQGYEVGTIGVTEPKIENDETIRTMLRLAEHDRLLFFERIRTADKKPFALDRIYMNEKYLGADYYSKYAYSSLLSYLSSVQDIHIFSSQCNLFAENASLEDAMKLGIVQNEALQVLEQTFYSNTGDPIFYGKSSIVNNILKFHIVRRR
ncbi:GntR family transcriptional regulator [Bacillaceae bacterium SIJ1]|uniref:GntR family transcriptional regulator n=1 Tax=Litoribacterium kuwaitense TaxID=1398745 RepID=UPI0013EC04D4|nr:GntR family transcriptional regulator [Litoribacterium kuwaitense]NGP45771.1 GntR family transcriptional regulator [Litoribacterium kuwaitense]